MKIKALILVGGYGTRLRPLTISCPKSVLPFMNRPMVENQIERLAKVGVEEVILAINYQGDIIKEDLKQLSQKYHIKITYSQEQQPLGTAGPIKLSEQLLKQDNQDGLIFVFNSDNLFDYPLEEMLEYHKEHKGEGTIALGWSDEVGRYGSVLVNEKQQIYKFVEKSKVFISDKINAGVYLLNVSVIDRIPLRFCMIEKQIFPQLAEEGKLYGFPLKDKHFFFDLGKPADYLEGQNAYLKYYSITSQKSQGNCLIDQTAKIGENCRIGPNVVIGEGCSISDGVRLKNCTIMKNSKIGTSTFIENSIISWNCKIGSWVRIQGLSTISEYVDVTSEVRITECQILSHKTISENVQKKILM